MVRKVISQSELGERFRVGHTNGMASNVTIEERENHTLLVGYGHAVYAYRNKDTGKITYCKGWYGYSPSTSCQLTKMGLEAMADEIVNEKVKTYRFPQAIEA